MRVNERLPTGPLPDQHWCRVVMNRECEKLVAGLGPERLTVLEISGYAWGKRGLPFRSYQATTFPEFDICASILDERFDLIIAEQVFEHLPWPYRAGRHVWEMLAPGGHFLITTPFLVRVHAEYNNDDCSRWTESGIRYLLAECGFDLDAITTGSWGNRACVRANFTRWVRYYAGLHSLKNEPDFPFVVWALAQKQTN
jgi:SAM-dependent methyltransferase